MRFLILSRFDRTLVREVLQVTLAVCAVLLVILVSMRLSKVLGQAVSGDIPAEAVLSYIFFKSTEKVALLLPLSLYLAQLLVLGRWYKDHEIEAWYACGLGLGGLYRALFLSAIPIAVLVFVFGVWVGPWAAQSGESVISVARSNTDVSGFSAGQFTESSDGSRVFYAERISDDGNAMENVFVFGQGEKREQKLLASAKRARLEVDRSSGSRFLVLEEGHRYDGIPFESPFRVVSFGSHGVVLEPKEVGQNDRRETWVTSVLWGDNRIAQLNELQWRVFFPLTVLVLTLFVVPVGSLPPRKSRYARIPIGILLYIVYANALGINRSLVDDGSVPIWLGAWWPHLPFAIVAIILIVRLRSWRAAKAGEAR